MKSMLFPITAAVASLLPLPTLATDAGTEAIAAIGRINGMALACQQPAIASRARNAVTTSAWLASTRLARGTLRFPVSAHATPMNIAG